MERINAVKKTSRSLSFTFIAIIFFCVSSVLSLDAAVQFNQVKRATTAEMEREISSSLSALRQNIGDLIESYSINEYEKLIQTELEKSDYYAIVVDDFNMGKITGEKSYKTGRVKSSHNSLLDIASVDRDLIASFESCCYRGVEDIESSDGQIIGRIRIYHSYQKLNDSLNEIIEDTVEQVLTLALVLSAALFMFIRLFILRPVTEIIDSIEHRDETGIPMVEAPEDGPSELRELAKAMNNMLHSIKGSRLELKEQHQFLQTIIDSVEDAIRVINVDYSIQMMNSAAREIINKNTALENWNYVRCYDLSYPHCAACDDGRKECPLTRAMNNQQISKIIHTIRDESETKHIEVSGAPLLDSKGRSLLSSKSPEM